MKAQGKRKLEVDGSDEGDVAMAVAAVYIVYAIVFLPLNLVVYVGSTARSEHFERAGEHLRICGGARRVAIAFAQRWFQPVLNFFEFRELWRGECTPEQAIGVEQHFITKHDTKVARRSRDPCMAHDLELMEPDTVPKQLNLKNACADMDMVAWAARRVQRDSAITTTLSPVEQQQTSHLFEMARIVLEADAEATAQVVVRRCIDKYVSMQSQHRVGATEVHADLVRVHTALTGDDGTDARRCCRAKMLAFNFDHHGDETWSAAFVVAEFRAVEAALGIVAISGPCNKSQTSDEAFTDLVGQTVGRCKRVQGKLVTVKVCMPRRPIDPTLDMNLPE